MSVRLIFVTSVAALLVTQRSSQPEIPVGVRYTRAVAAVNAKAEARLRNGLSEDPFRLARIQGIGGSSPLLVGPFLSGRLIQERAADPADFAEAEYSVPFSKEIKPVMAGLAADTPQRRAKLDETLTRAIGRSAASTIRRLSPTEMALIWFYIGWDLSEPLFAVEYGTRVLVVDFDEAGEAITWLEDISAPCFRVSWQGGGLAPCYCTVAVDQSPNYPIVFREQKTNPRNCGSPAVVPGGRQ